MTEGSSCVATLVDNLKKNVPAELKEMDRWVLMKSEVGEDGKLKKVPYQIRSPFHRAAIDNPKTWGSFNEGIGTFEKHGDWFLSLAFAFTDDDPYSVVDLDDVIDSDGNTIPGVEDIIRGLNSYTERSCSGSGFHIIARGKKPGNRCHSPILTSLEFYDFSRFITLTGDLYDPQSLSIIRDAQEGLDQLYEKYFPESEKEKAQGSQVESIKRSDDEVINLARTGKSKGKFLRLWAGDKTDYDDDDSRADLGLCCILAGLTKDPEQIDRLFRRSQLFRDKWESRRGDGTYGSQTIQKALEFIGPVFLPVVVTNGRQERELTDEVISVMQGPTCKRFYLRGKSLCSITYSENDGPSIVDLTEDSLLGDLNNAADWVEINQKKETHPSKLSRRIISIILGKESIEGFPPLEGLATSPFLRADGTICENHGYDAQSKKYLWIEGQEKFRSVPENPSPAETAHALKLLEELFIDFPFESDASRANTIAYLITPSVMSVINAETPMALLDASIQGSGKSLICKCCSMIYTGMQPDMTTPPVGEAEWKKTILSLLIGGHSFIIFDNAEHKVDSEALHSALTSTRCGGRILGVSEYRSYPNRSVWALTGNNLDLSPDLSRRGYWIRLIPNTATPQNRTGFKHPDILEWVEERRQDFLWAILILGRAWFAAGCPKSKIRPLGGFERWSNVVGGILEHAGIHGFLANSDDLWAEANSESQAWEQFVLVLYSHYKDEPIKTAEICSTINEYPELFSMELPNSIVDAVASGNGTTCVSKLGKALQKVISRRFGPAGIYLTRGARTSRTNPWCLKVDHPELLPEEEITPIQKPTSPQNPPLTVEGLLKSPITA